MLLHALINRKTWEHCAIGDSICRSDNNACRPTNDSADEQDETSIISRFLQRTLQISQQIFIGRRAVEKSTEIVLN